MLRAGLLGHLALITALVPAAPNHAAGDEDPFVALETNTPGFFTYVRREEIEALTDVSPSHCILSLLSQTKNIRAFQKCSSILEKLQRNDFVSVQADFGNTYIIPENVASITWTSHSRCQITLKSAKFVYAKQSCNDVHDALVRE